jgi:alkanesulfonate monooxygenase SsuD/methylene tetrahydromethanopterin reductase-like flavin-dependent oxidoreductase (luciferase family)
VTYRHPSVLAAQAMTVDHASHGRLELALGAAWFEQEHRELGIPFPPLGERFDLLEDELEIVTRLFTGETVSYDGRRISLHDARMRPRPVQQPHPPIWIGGTGVRRTLPLAARFADALSLDDLDTARRHASKWRDAGYGYLVCGWPEAADAQVEAFAKDVLPEFA